MKPWFNARELAGLPGMPTCSASVLHKAKRENWMWRKHKGLGGGKDFNYLSLPDETRTALATKAIEQKNIIKPARKQSKQLNKMEITHAVRELTRLQEKKEILHAESKRLIATILKALGSEQ